MQVCKRNKTNYYKTPEEVKQKLYSLLDIQEKETGNHIDLENMVLFDPCAGDGTLLRDVKCKKAINWDIEPRSEDVEQHDSLNEHWPHSDMVVMNPPFDVSLISEFFKKWKTENNSRYLLVIGNGHVKRHVNIARYTKWEGLYNLQNLCVLGFRDRYNSNCSGAVGSRIYVILNQYLKVTDHDLGPDYRYIKSIESYSVIVGKDIDFFTFDRAKKSLRKNSKSRIFMVPLEFFKLILEYLKWWASTYSGTFVPVVAVGTDQLPPVTEETLKNLKEMFDKLKQLQMNRTNYIKENTI